MKTEHDFLFEGEDLTLSIRKDINGQIYVKYEGAEIKDGVF